MNRKCLATLSPLCLSMLAGSAWADLSPYSLGASETVQHQSNVLHDDSDVHSDWLSTTQINAGIDQTLGREHILASAAVDLDRYRYLHSRDDVGYNGSAELDWSTIGDLSGAIGGDVRRQQYLYGLGGDQQSTSPKNLQTDDHAFARAQLGGMGRWSISSGFDASERRYSDPSFDVNDQKQWGANLGTNYETSPDLSFGIQGRYIRGTYPKIILDSSEEMFSSKTVGANVRWNASGNSSFDANVGYTQQDTQGQPSQHFVSGALNWNWAPPSHFNFTLGLVRDSSIDASSTAAIVNTNTLNTRSINNTVNLAVKYELTAKVSLDASAQYIMRKYSDAQIPTGFESDGSAVFQSASGDSHTSRLHIGAHYAATRTTDLSCGVAHETHTASSAIVFFAPKYTDNTVQCVAAIRLD